MSSPAGVQQLQLTATLDLGLQADQAASAVFDDFDVTVTAPYCWGKLSYCRGVRTRLPCDRMMSWGSGSAADVPAGRPRAALSSAPASMGT